MSASSNRSWAIIGVVGKSNLTESRENNEFLQLAENVGREIAKAGQVVLTGGHHGLFEYAVKYRALKGALNWSNESSAIVRLIGIVPKSISKKLANNGWSFTRPVERRKQRNIHWLYCHTGLESELRDPITGQTVDALIVMYGENGTKREVKAAETAGTPIVFLKSNLKFESWQEEKLTDENTAETPGQAVEMVMNLLKDEKGILLRGAFPSSIAIDLSEKKSAFDEGLSSIP